MQPAVAALLKREQEAGVTGAAYYSGFQPRADRIKSVLGWTPRLDDLDTIVSTSLAWERKLLAEPWQP